MITNNWNLSPREHALLVNLVSQPQSNKALARLMGISVGTVKLHLHSIYQKTGTRGRTELVVSVLRNIETVYGA